jgi:hypothetical protein
MQGPGWAIEGNRIPLCVVTLSSKYHPGGLCPVFKYYDIALGVPNRQTARYPPDTPLAMRPSSNNRV